MKNTVELLTINTYETIIFNDAPDFLFFLKDTVKLLSMFYNDIPNAFYFERDSSEDLFSIRLYPSNQNVLTVLKERCSALYKDFQNAMSIIDKEMYKSAQDKLIYNLYKSNLISLKSMVEHKKLISKSNVVTGSGNLFHNRNIKANMIHNDMLINENFDTPSAKKYLAFKKAKQVLSLESDTQSKKAVVQLFSLLNMRYDNHHFENNYNFSWLYFLLRESHTKWLDFLIKEDLIVLEILGSKTLPLLVSILKDDAYALNLLINADTSVLNETYHKKETMIEKCATLSWINEIFSLLSFAIQSGAYDCISEILSAGADVNLKVFEGESALFCATRLNDETAIKLLVLRGADLSIENNKGCIAAEYIGKDFDMLFDYMEDVRKKAR